MVFSRPFTAPCSNPSLHIRSMSAFLSLASISVYHQEIYNNCNTEVPFIEGEEATFADHAGCAVQCAAIDSRRWVHVTRLDDIHRWCNARRTEARTERWQEMTWPIIGHQSSTQHQRLFDDVVRHQLRRVHYGVACDVRQRTCLYGHHF